MMKSAKHIPTLCPACNSYWREQEIKREGFSLGKAVVGTLVAGPYGLAAGALGTKTRIYHCSICDFSYMFKGEFFDENNLYTSARQHYEKYKVTKKKLIEKQEEEEARKRDAQKVLEESRAYKAYQHFHLQITDFVDEMFENAKYGSSNTLYESRIKIMTQSVADKTVAFFRDWKTVDIRQLSSLKVSAIADSLWFYSMNCQQSKYNEGQSIIIEILRFLGAGEPKYPSDIIYVDSFDSVPYDRAARRVGTKIHDFLLASQWQMTNRIAGEEVILEKLKNYYNENYQGQDLIRIKNEEYIASALMWMGAYRSEKMVLNNILAKGTPMSPECQSRLNTITRLGSAPNSFARQSTGIDGQENLHQMGNCINLAALAWKDNDYSSFFDDLILKNQSLKECLALREDCKDPIPAARMPEKEEIKDAVLRALRVDYEESATCESFSAVAVSEGVEDTITGFLLKTNECPHLGILLCLIKIGKKVTIKYYSLFLPNDDSIQLQRKKALSMFKRLSPTDAGWEDSLKSTVTIALQRMLNSQAESGSSVTNEPIF